MASERERACGGSCGRAALPGGSGGFCCAACERADPGSPLPRAHADGCAAVGVRLLACPVPYAAGASGGDLTARVGALLDGPYRPWTPEARQLAGARDATSSDAAPAPPDAALTLAAELLRLFASTTVVGAPSCAY